MTDEVLVKLSSCGDELRVLELFQNGPTPSPKAPKARAKAPLFFLKLSFLLLASCLNFFKYLQCPMLNSQLSIILHHKESESYRLNPSVPSEMARALRVLLALSAYLLSGSFKFSNVRHTSTLSKSRLFDEPPQAPESYERNKDGSFSDKTDVKETLSKLMAVLGPLAPSRIEDGVKSQEKLIQDVQDGFSKILLDVRESGMTPMEKRMIITEANMILSDMKTKEVRIQLRLCCVNFSTI